MNTDILVLNKSYHPMEFKNVFDAFSSVYNERAVFIDTDYAQYTWEDWVENWSDAKKIAESCYDVIGVSNYQVALPKVMMWKEFNQGYDRIYAKFSRRNLMLRDDHRCQYCGCSKSRNNELTFEHIIPQARGGKTNWMNVVLACMKCNQEKGCHTPEEVNMKLIRQPFIPKWYELHETKILMNFRSWKDLFSELYWNVDITNE